MLTDYLPKDKVTLVSSAEESGTNSGNTSKVRVESDMIAGLKKAGFDTQQALVYTQDESFYKEILINFFKEHPERAGKLEGFYSEKNWNDYTVLAHALKTNARTIGALELSDLAASVELASKSMDEITLSNEHAKLLELYGKTADLIGKIIGDEAGDVPDEDDVSDDEEILEFMPENEK